MRYVVTLLGLRGTRTFLVGGLNLLLLVMQMAAAKRAMACGPHLVKDPTDNGVQAQLIAAWRGARGFKTTAVGKHGCCGRPNFARLAGNIYLVCLANFYLLQTCTSP
jgi:hypothetical protein